MCRRVHDPEIEYDEYDAALDRADRYGQRRPWRLGTDPMGWYNDEDEQEDNHEDD